MPLEATVPKRMTSRTPRSSATIVIVLLTIVGLTIRLLVARQSFYGDELATYWIITTRGLRSLISALYNTHDEITPPLFFVSSWLTTQIGHAAELVRAPSVIAGTLTIPAVFFLGRRTLGQPAALVATALTAFSPFMIYYSTEARAYGVLMLLVTVSTLALLLAIDTGRRRWWALYALCACGAFYTHYTSIFYLVVQFVWVLWAYPEARRPVIVASAVALAGVLPWTHAVISASNSPTTAIMSDLSPFTPSAVTSYVAHWALGYPYPVAGNLGALPGAPSLILLGLAAAVVLAGWAVPRWRARPATVDRQRIGSVLTANRRPLLVVLLLLATPVGEALESAVSTHVFGIRNLASSWPALALVAGAVLVSPRAPARLAACALAIVAFALAGVKMLGARYSRPNFRAVATFIDHSARPGDVVIDETGLLSPGPLTGLDVFLRRRMVVLRAGSPAEGSHPFAFSDPIATLQSAIDQASTTYRRGRVFLVDAVFPRGTSTGPASRASALQGRFPGGYHVLTQRIYPGIIDTRVRVYSDPAAR